MLGSRLHSETQRLRRKFKKLARPPPTHEISVTTSGYALIARYLLKFRGSIYRLIWVDLTVWLILFYAINLTYRFVLSKPWQTKMENLVEQVNAWQAKIPVTFLLGFFVSNVVSRWWNIFASIPRAPHPLLVLASFVQNSERPAEAAKVRLTITRYLNLAWALALCQLCSGLRSRLAAVRRFVVEFGTGFSLHEGEGEGGVAMRGFGEEAEEEEDAFDSKLRRCLQKDAQPHLRCLRPLAALSCDPIVRERYGRIVTPSEFAVFLDRARQVGPGYSLEWFLPLYWASLLVRRAETDGLVTCTRAPLKEIHDWSAKIRKLLNYSRRQLPLVYTQVVIIAVYAVYACDLISRQIVSEKDAVKRGITSSYIDMFIPIVGVVHVVFIVGWFKVALVLIDPFGKDEEDFPFSNIFNANMKRSVVQASDLTAFRLKHCSSADEERREEEAALALAKDLLQEGGTDEDKYGTFSAESRR